MVSAKVDKATIKKLRMQLDRLDLKKQEAALIQILSTSSLPIRKAAKAKAKTVIEANSGINYKRNGTTYHIASGTVEKSIGVIKLKRARVPAIDVGYRRKGKFDGWFAHYVDAGTKNRTQGKNRGQIRPRNIMDSGKTGIPQAEQKIKKDILRMIKRLSK